MVNTQGLCLFNAKKRKKLKSTSVFAEFSTTPDPKIKISVLICSCNCYKFPCMGICQGTANQVNVGQFCPFPLGQRGLTQKQSARNQEFG